MSKTVTVLPDNDALSLPKQQILDSSKLREFADVNFKFDENGGQLSKEGRKNCGKSRNCLLQAISPLPKLFSKDLYSRQVKIRAFWKRVKTAQNESTCRRQNKT